MDVAVDGRWRNEVGLGHGGRGVLLRDVGAMKVQRVMGIPDIPRHEPT